MAFPNASPLLTSIKVHIPVIAAMFSASSYQLVFSVESSTWSFFLVVLDWRRSVGMFYRHPECTNTWSAVLTLRIPKQLKRTSDYTPYGLRSDRCRDGRIGAAQAHCRPDSITPNSSNYSNDVTNTIAKNRWANKWKHDVMALYWNKPNVHVESSWTPSGSIDDLIIAQVASVNAANHGWLSCTAFNVLLKHLDSHMQPYRLCGWCKYGCKIIAGGHREWRVRLLVDAYR